MHFIIDLIIIGIIIVIALISAKHGFVRTMIEAFGFTAALILAFSVSKPLAAITYEKAIEQPILNSVTSVDNGNTEETVDALWESLPDFLTQNSKQFGISKENLKSSVSESTHGNLKSAVKDITEKTVKPAVVSILKTVYAVVIVLLLSLLVKILAKLINKAFSFKTVGKLNKFLGGLLGVVKGIITAFILCEIIVLLISFTDNGFWIFNNANIEKTIIFKFLTNVF